MAKRRERERNFEAGVLLQRERERGREEQHFSVSSRTPPGKMLIISRCFLRVKMHAKKGASDDLSFHIHTFSPPPFDCPFLLARCSLTRRLQFLSLLASSIPLFLFLFKQAAFNSRIFVHFRGLSSLRPNFGFVWKFTEGAALNVFLNKQQDFQDNSGIRFENRDRRSNTSVLVDRFFEFSSVRQTKSSKRSELIKFRATRNVIETLGRFCMQSCGHKFPVFDRFHDEECNDVFEGGERNRSHVSPSLSSNYPVPSVPRMHGIWLNSVVSRLLSTTFSFTRASEIRRSLPLCWLTANDCIIDRPLLFDRRPRYNLCVLQSSKISNKLNI